MKMISSNFAILCQSTWHCLDKCNHIDGPDCLGPFVGIVCLGSAACAWGWWTGLGMAWVAAMGIWGLEEWKGWPIRAYLVREYDVVYRHGWWSRTTVAVPFDRIQHSEIQQGPLGRWLGHCTLKLYTAGSAGANLEIPGLSMATAVTFADVLKTLNMPERSHSVRATPPTAWHGHCRIDRMARSGVDSVVVADSARRVGSTR